MRLVFLLCLAGSIAHAEQTPTVHWLMDEPVTLWDLGLLRTERHLRDRFDSSGSVRLRVVYESRASKLIIQAREYGKVRKDPKSHCRNIVELVREALNVFAETGYPPRGTRSLLARFYAHVDYHSPSPDRPPDISEELDAMTVIRVSIPKIIHCEVPLMGKDISCEPYR